MTTELAPGIWHLALTGVNAYLAQDGGDLVLIDAGLPWQAKAIRAGIRAIGRDVDDIERVLLTHDDMDHVGGLAALNLDAPIYAGAADAAMLRGDRRPPLTNHKGILQRVLGRMVRRPTAPVRDVREGETIGSFTAYHTPAHTPGHMAYVSQSLDVAFVGDLVRSSNEGVVPTPWLFTYDPAADTRSVQRLVDRMPSVSVLCPGHGAPLPVAGAAALARLAEST